MSEFVKDQTESTKSSGRIQTLIEMLCGHDAIRREYARRALVAKGKAATGSLIQLLSESRALVRWEAVKALGDLRDPAASPALVDALEDEDIDIRWLAAVGLIALKHKAVKPLLSALMRRPQSIWLRQGAHHIIHELVKRELFTKLVPMLKALEQSDPEISVPLAAYQTMQSLRCFS